MEPKKEYNKKVEACITSLCNERENLKRRVTSYRVISEKIFRDIVEQIDCIFRRHLRNLFGEEYKPDQNWFCEEFLNFRGEPGESTEELVFAFWGCDGTESYSKKGEPTPFLRENIYLRGTRWEVEKNRENFYKNFREIKFLFKNHVPVDFFGCLATQCPPILRITTVQSERKDKIPTIVLPLGQNFVKKFPPNSSLYKLADYICKFSQNEQKETSEKLENLPFRLVFPDNIKNKIRYDTDKKLLIFKGVMSKEEKDELLKLSNDDNYKQAVEALPQRSQKEIDDKVIGECWDKGRKEIKKLKFIEELITQFKKAGVEYLQNEYTPEEIVLMVAISFQYYSWPFREWPYDLYIIGGSTPKERENIFACFSLAVRRDNDKISQSLERLKDLIKGFSGYKEIEKIAWGRLSENVHFYWMWKREYENRKKRFEAICNATKFIVQGICEENKIKYKDISHRVKEFDKFYDKIVEKINSEPCEKELLELFRFPKIGFYRVIQKKYVKDVAGIRVNCYYKSDAITLWSLIKEDCEKDKRYQLASFDVPKKPSTEPGVFEYPRYHLWVCLGTERLTLPEYSKLKDIHCEIQIGTILEEGWAEVDHKIIYKSSSFLPKDVEKKLKHKSWSELLPSIGTTDKGFDELRGEYEKEDYKDGGQKS